MTLRHLKILAALFCVLGSICPSYPQEADGGIKFSCVSWNALSIQPVFYRSGEEFEEMRLIPGSRSRLYTTHQTGGLGLYKQTKNEEGELIHVLIGKCSFPEGAEQVLVFIDEDTANQELPLKLTAIDDSLLKFPRGAFRFVNFTAVPVSVDFAGKTGEIRPRDMKVIKSDVSDQGKLLPFLVKGPSGKVAYENRFFAQDTGRDMVFIFPPKRKGGRIEVRLLPQLLAKEPEPIEE